MLLGYKYYDDFLAFTQMIIPIIVHELRVVNVKNSSDAHVNHEILYICIFS